MTADPHTTSATIQSGTATDADREFVASTLRVGRIQFLNMYPMHWGLGVEPATTGVPTDINRAIVDGEIDVACMSVIEYARHADQLQLLPSMCVSAEGAVGSIFAICNAPLEQVRDIWVTPHTATSVVLLQVLLKLRGRSPELHLLEGDPADILEAGDQRAVLLIGDDAMQAPANPRLSAFEFADLGERWLAETGLPMVYAVWAIRREAAEQHPDAAMALDRLLVDSVRRFATDDTAIADAVGEYHLTPEAVQRYVDRLCYAFGTNERKGMMRYLRMASEAGLLGHVPSPTWAEGAAAPDESDPVELDDAATSLLSDEQIREMYVRTVGTTAALKTTPEDDEHIAMCLQLESDARARDVDDVLHRALLDERIDEVDAIALLQSSRLVDVGQVAHELRLRRTPADAVTFVIDRNINYTNYCTTNCGFCAFYRRPGDSAEGYLQSTDEILERIRETVALGGTAALMQGGHNPDLGIEWYVDLFKAVKQEFPTFHLHALSPPEIQHIARRSKLTISETLTALRDAGHDSLPGGGGEVLVDRVRKILAPKKTKSSEWLGIMAEAQRMGMSTTATMMYGHVELLSERILHMQRVRQVQDETHGFRAFISWTFQPGSTPLAQIIRAGLAPYQEHFPITPTPFTYLLTQAVSRIYLDNFDNIQSSWVTQGMKVGQAALWFGANDLGSIMMEENVVSSAGTTYRASTEDFVHAINATGMRAVQRDTLYRTVREY